VIVARYLSNGSPDSSFGNNGAAVVDGGSTYDECVSLLLMPDGKIMAVGDAGYLLLARFTAQGGIDSSYGVNGKVITNIGNNAGDLCVRAGLQSDGKPIVLCRIDGEYPYTMVRFTIKGVVDSSFGINGITGTKSYMNSSLFGNTMLVQPDDKVILAGYSSNSRGIQNAFMSRYLKNGKRDPDFGTSGLVFLNDKSRKYFYALAQQNDGKIIAAGCQADKYGNEDALISRYTLSGMPDSSFGTNGFTINAFEGYHGRIISLCIQQDGKIVSGAPESLNAFILRYNADNAQPFFSKKPGLAILACEIKISPNPVNNQLQLTGLSAKETSSLIISDLNGNVKMQQQVTITNYTWMVSQLPRGIYVLSVQTKSKPITSINFIKK